MREEKEKKGKKEEKRKGDGMGWYIGKEEENEQEELSTVSIKSWRGNELLSRVKSNWCKN